MDLTLINQKLVKETIQNPISKQELPVTAQNRIITTPRTSRIYFKPKIHKPKNPGRLIVFACRCPTELISSCLDKIMVPIVKSLPSHIKDTNHAIKIFRDFTSPTKTNLYSPRTSLLYTLPYRTTKDFTYFDQRSSKEPSSMHCSAWSN